jgi:FAD/FMN-containing dehydrogenase
MGLSFRYVHTLLFTNAQKSETKVIVISLAKYIPTSDWNNVLNLPAKTVKLGAGRTYLDLMAIARPAGLLLKSQTAGPFFTIGGVVANPSVHGATMDEERLNSHMISLKAMLSNGSLITVTGNDVKAWRGSLGLLGIILAVELQLRDDTGIRMDQFDDDLSGAWSQANFESKILAVANTHHTAEWFYNVYTERVQVFAINYTGAPGFNYAATTSIYSGLQAQFPDLAITGGVVTSTNGIIQLIQGWLQAGYLLNRAIAALGWSTQSSAWSSNSNAQRDGYWVAIDNIVYFKQVQTYIPCITDCITDHVMFNAVNAARGILLSAANNILDAWQPNLPLGTLVLRTNVIRMAHCYHSTRQPSVGTFGSRTISLD